MIENVRQLVEQEVSASMEQQANAIDQVANAAERVNQLVNESKKEIEKFRV